MNSEAKKKNKKLDKALGELAQICEEEEKLEMDLKKREKKLRDKDMSHLLLQKDDKDNSYLRLTDKKRVTVSTYKGKVVIDIREFYEKDGEELPGKKGISLTADAFKILMDARETLEKEIN